MHGDQVENQDGSTHHQDKQMPEKTPTPVPAPVPGLGNVVAPFLSRHANKRYCYRHHPDVLCNQQADESRMSELQHDMEALDKEEDRQAIAQVWSVFSAAPTDQRLLILKGLLAQCCYPQLSALSDMMKDLIRIDFMSALPPELAFKVLCYLDTGSLCRAAQVSKHWKAMADDDVVWHRMCEQHIDRKCTKCGWGLPLLEKKRLRDSKKAMEQRAKQRPRKRTADEMEGNGTAEVTPKRKTRPWKEVYAERYRVELNWRKGLYKLVEFRDEEALEDEEEDSDSILCLQFCEQYLITGSQKGKVTVWDVESGKMLRRLEGHVRAVNALKYDQTKLVTASSDHTVRIWNYRTGECITTFQGHEDRVLCLDFDQTLIASGSSDNNIKVWDFETKSCFTLRGHIEGVNDVKIHSKSRTLFSASEDQTVRMWCLNTKRCLRVFGGEGDGHVAQVETVIPLVLDHLEGGEDYHHSEAAPETRADGSPTHLLSASLDNNIKLWDIPTGRCVRTLFGHVEGVWTIAADTFRIVSGSHDKTVKVWDLQSGRCWHTFSGPKKPICCVGLSDTRFASGGDDGIVRMYCFDD